MTGGGGELVTAATPRSDGRYWRLLLGCGSGPGPGPGGKCEALRREAKVQDIPLDDDEGNANGDEGDSDRPGDVPVDSERQSLGWLPILSRLIGGDGDDGEVDLSRLKASISMSAPVSSLELVGDFVRNGGGALHAIRASFEGSEGDAVARMEAVAQFIFSTLRFDPDWPMEGFQGKRPHMPLLGETSLQFFTIPNPNVNLDESRSFMDDGNAGGGSGERLGLAYVMCEQIGYKPKTTGCFMDAPALGISMTSVARPNIKLKANRVEMKITGTRSMKIKRSTNAEDVEETYEMASSPHINLRNIFLGGFFTEFAGYLNIRCKETGLTCRVRFHPAGFMGVLGRKRHSVEGEIVRENEDSNGDTEVLKRLAGYWTDKVYIWSALDEVIQSSEVTSDKNVKVLFDYSLCRGTCESGLISGSKDVENRFRQDGLMSQVLWKSVNQAIEEGNLQEASSCKAKLTRTQRKYHHMSRAGKAKETKPRFFTRVQEDSVRECDVVVGDAELGFWIPNKNEIFDSVRPFPRLPMQPKADPFSSSFTAPSTDPWDETERSHSQRSDGSSFSAPAVIPMESFHLSSARKA